MARAKRHYIVIRKTSGRKALLLRLYIAEIGFELIDPESLTLSGNEKRRQKRGLRLAA